MSVTADSKPQTRLVGTSLALWLAVVVTAVLVGVLALGGMVIEGSVVSWRPASADAATTALQLAARAPQSWETRVGCGAVRRLSEKKPPTAFGFTLIASAAEPFSDAGLRLMMVNDRLHVLDGSRTVPGMAVPLPTSDTCEVVFRYDLAGDRLTLDNGTSSATGILTPEYPLDERPPFESAPFVLSGLTTDEALLPEVASVVRTAPAMAQQTWWRPACLIALALLSVALALLVAGRRPWWSRIRGLVMARPVASDLVVAAAVVLGVLIAPPIFDDGWFLAIARSHADQGWFSQFYTHLSAPQPLGFTWFAILGPLAGEGGIPAFLYRVPSAVSLVMAWWIFRRFVVDFAVPTERRRLAHSIGAAVVVCALPGLLLSLRPESYVSFLLACTLAVVLRCYRRPSIVSALALMAVAGLGLTAGQSGIVVPCAALVAVPAFWSRYRNLDRAARPRAGRRAVLAIAAAAGVTSVAMLAAGNIWVILYGLSAFASDPSGLHANFLLESLRLGELRSPVYGGAPSVITFVGILVIAAASWLTRPGLRRATPATLLGAGAVAAVAGLALTGSKLLHHFGAVTFSAAALLCLLAGYTPTRGHVTRIVSMLVGLGVVGWLAVRPIIPYTPATLAAGDVDNLERRWPATFLPVSGLVFWVVLFIVCAAGVACSVRLRRGSFALPPAVLAATWTWAVVLSVLAAGLAPSWAPSEPWSWTGQQVAALRGQGCGLAGESTNLVPREVSPLVEATAPDSSGNARASTRGAGPEELSAPPFDLPVYLPSDPGTAHTPWFLVPAGGDIQMWFQGAAEENRVTLEFAGEGTAVDSSPGQVIDSQSTVRPALGYGWHTFAATPPAGARWVRIVWFFPGGPAAVTGPGAVLGRQSLAAAAAAGPIWNDPGTALQANCARLPSIANGLLEPVRYSVGVPRFGNGASVAAASRVIELACPQEDSKYPSRCAFLIEQPADHTQVTAYTEKWGL